MDGYWFTLRLLSLPKCHHVVLPTQNFLLAEKYAQVDIFLRRLIMYFSKIQTPPRIGKCSSVVQIMQMREGVRTTTVLLFISLFAESTCNEHCSTIFRKRLCLVGWPCLPTLAGPRRTKATSYSRDVPSDSWGTCLVSTVQENGATP